MDIIVAILQSPAFWAAVVVGVFGLWLNERRSRATSQSIVDQISADAAEDEETLNRAKEAADRAEREARSRVAEVRRNAERKYKGGQ